MIAIDGPAGSGKTTLAAHVSAAGVTRKVSVVTVHLDDLYAGWTGLDDELSLRVERQVLAPLAVEEPAHWQRYDWHAERFDAWETFAPPDLLVLEGCGSGDRAHAAYTSVLVWVEADENERIRRGVARDGEQVLPQWCAWMVAEAAHFAANDTRERADLHLIAP
jgi:uridine kinase